MTCMVGCPRWLRLLRLLLWKNLLLQKRRPWWTFFGIFLPLLLIVIIMIFRQKVEPEEMADPLRFESFSVHGIPSRDASFGGGFGDGKPKYRQAKFTIVYSPKNKITSAIMRRAAHKLYLKRLKGFADESTMVEYILKKRAFALAHSGSKEILPGITIGGRSDAAAILCGISFDATDWSKPLHGANVTYSLRFPHSPPTNMPKFSKFRRGDHWFTERMYPRRSTIGPRGANGYGSDTPGYYIQGFLAVQWALNNVIMKHVTSNKSLFEDVKVGLKQFAYPPYFDDPYTSGLQAQFPYLLMVCLSICCLDIIKNVAVEKQEKLKETMKIMGLPNWLHWLAWFIKSFVYMAIILLLMTTMLKVWIPPYGRVISYSQWSVLLVFFLCYSVALISFSFMITTFFSKSNTAAAAGGVVYFLTFIPFFFAYFNYNDLTLGHKITFCLSLNTCLGLGCKLIGMFEGKGTGVTWATVATPIYADDDFSMLTVWALLLVDALICATIAWYVERVRPGDFGVALPWYFPFTSSYWSGGVDNARADSLLEKNESKNGEDNVALLEKRNVSTENGIKIRRLRKVFGDQCGRDSNTYKVAVRGVSMEMVENEIFVLLGHNGAGKSTTISMLTGMFSPTGGDAFVRNKSILTDMADIRREMGICPQHDVLFDDLTVREHLIFFGRLKNCSPDVLDSEIDSLLGDLLLEPKKFELAKTLSGGQKRKLSVAIALIGQSKVVLLDEPTSGMDPSARRLTWNVLKKYNAGRTMLLTTHFMDEADVLGHVIAIMASGKVVCTGSPLFLKTKLGAGYHLVIVKASKYDHRSTDTLVKTHVPEAVVERNILAEVAFVLPKERVHCFSDLFRSLEFSKADLGISSFGCAVTSIEEVFLRVGDDETAMSKLMSAAESADQSTVEQEFAADPTQASNVNEKSPVEENGEVDRNKGFTLACQQFYAMLVKRMLHTWRNRLVTVSQLLVPNLFTLLILFIIQISPDMKDSPPLNLNLRGFGPTLSPVLSKPGSLMTNHLTQTYQSYFDDNKDEVVDVRGINVPAFQNLSDIDQFALKFSTKSLRKYTDEILIGAHFGSIDESCFRGVGRSVSDYLQTMAAESTEKERKQLNDAIVQRFKGSRFSSAYGGLVCQTYAKEIELEANRTNISLEELHDTKGGQHFVEGYFNDNPFHTPAISLHALSHAMMRTVSNVSLYSYNHPLPRTVNDKLDDTLTLNFRFSGSFNFGFLYGMSFLGASFIVFLIKERVSKSKHIQILSGVHYFNFWLATFVWDYVNFLVPCFITVLLFYPFQIEAFINSGIHNSIILMLCFGLGQLPFIYCISLLFQESTAGFVYTSVLNIFVGLFLMIAIGILKAFDLDELADSIQSIALLISPPFVIGNAMQNLYVNYWNFRMCELDLPTTRDLFKSFIPADALQSSGMNWFGPLDEDELLDWFEDEKIFEKSSGINLTLGEILAKPAKEALCLIVEQANVSYPCCPNSDCEDTIVGCAVHVPYLSLEFPGVGRHLLYFFAHFVIFFLILFVYESEILRAPFYALCARWRFFRSRFGQKSRSSLVKAGADVEMAEGFVNGVPDGEEDADVEAERRKIREFRNKMRKEKTNEVPLLMLDELKKIYTSSQVTAVDGISVGIPRGELFGLLGLNGAGKTTTFKMLTGDETVTEGNAILSGVFDVRSNLRQMQQRMGYCPQSDALIDQMTGRETLRMYARLRGIFESRIEAMIEEVTKDLLLDDHIDRLVGGYSGGNKRKLSTAIALIGDPQLVLLDEPTTGMDPVARRLLWDALIRIRDKSRQSIVLTSHSMEECDTLCTRLAIMVNGRFTCLGSPQYLKGKFGEGFHLVVRLRIDDDDDDESGERAYEEAARFVRSQFPDARLEDFTSTARGSLVCQIPETATLSWSEVFRVMETAKEELCVDDYSLSQTTLEKVFLNFAKSQRSEDGN